MSASVTGLCLCLCVYVYVYIIITTYIINILGTSDWLKIAARFAMESARKTNARSWAIDTDGSAAQPAPTIATYMDSGSAEQPAVQGPTSAASDVQQLLPCALCGQSADTERPYMYCISCKRRACRWCWGWYPTTYTSGTTPYVMCNRCIQDKSVIGRPSKKRRCSSKTLAQQNPHRSWTTGGDCQSLPGTVRGQEEPHEEVKVNPHLQRI